MTAIELKVPTVGECVPKVADRVVEVGGVEQGLDRERQVEGALAAGDEWRVVILVPERDARATAGALRLARRLGDLVRGVRQAEEVC